VGARRCAAHPPPPVHGELRNIRPRVIRPHCLHSRFHTTCSRFARLDGPIVRSASSQCMENLCDASRDLTSRSSVGDNGRESGSNGKGLDRFETRVFALIETVRLRVTSLSRFGRAIEERSAATRAAYFRWRCPSLLIVRKIDGSHAANRPELETGSGGKHR